MSDAVWWEVLCWGSLALVLYSYVVYPVVIAFAAGVAQVLRDLRFVFGKRERRAAPRTIAELQPVAVVVAAYNEARHVEARVRNLLAQDYPPELLTVYIGSDGSTDATAAILSTLAGPRVRVFCYETNRGKASVLNDLLAEVREPIVVFTDANTVFDPDAVNELVNAMGERVGCVCGELRLQPAAGDNQDSAFWKMEQFLKFCEARIGGLLGANGAIYAIRRELYTPLRPDTICDDLLIAMQIRAKGWEVSYHPVAIATEDTPSGIEHEYLRRLRIGVGNYQILFRHPEFFWKTGLATSFAYFSHKALRWITPHLCAFTLMASAALGTRFVFYRGFVLLQLACYAISAFLYGARHRVRVGRLVSAMLMLVSLNAAFARAFLVFLRGRSSGAWTRSDRS